MKLKAKELIKTLLSQKGLKQKDLLLKMTELTGRKYSESSFSHRAKNGTVSYNEVLLITEILGYEMEFKDTNTEMI